jgi:LysM repeat protein
LAQKILSKEQSVSQDKVPQTDEYIVKRGDTLTEIAVKTGQNLQELLQKNRQIKNPNRIYVGQRIEIGKASNIYTVKPGDTLSDIAKAKHTTVGDIMRANPKQIGNRNLIYPGQKLIIPTGVNQSVPTDRKTPQASKPKQPVPSKPIGTTPPKVISVPTRPQVNTPTNTTNVNNSTQDVKLSSHLKLKSKNIELSQLVKKEMSQVAEEYFKRTGKDLVITDGNRTAHDQAERIYDKIIVHEENIYTNKAALAEVKTAYNQAKAQGKSRPKIVNEMAHAIQNQMNRRVYISRHLIGQGADVQIRFMSTQDREAFKQSVKTVGGARILNEGNHWHIEVDAQPMASKTTPQPPITQTPQTPQSQQTQTIPIGDLKLGVNEEYHDALILAQKRTGIDAAALAAVINAEAARDKSGKWLANSQAPKGTARGLTQFLKGTWLERAHIQGSYLNEVALQKGFIREVKGKFVVVDENSLLALRDNPTVSIVTAAEYGKNNLELLNRSGLLPRNLSDDQKAKYMYVAHHEGFGGALRYLTNSNDVDEATAKYILTKNYAAGLKDKYGSYVEAYKHWAEGTSRRNFPSQVGSKTMNTYVQKYGNYEQGYRAWLTDYVNAKIQPESYRK